MKKLKVKWTPEITQDFHALTSPRSPFYDKEYTNRILKKYKTLDNYLKSDDFKKLENKYYGKK